MTWELATILRLDIVIRAARVTRKKHAVRINIVGRSRTVARTGTAQGKLRLRRPGDHRRGNLRKFQRHLYQQHQRENFRKLQRHL